MNIILAICAAAVLLPASAACRADEVFPVAHKEPIAIQVRDGRGGAPQAGIHVLLTGGYDRRDLAESQWQEESVTDAEGKVRLSDALRNLPLLRVEVLKRHSCAPAAEMAALSVEQVRQNGMSATNHCGTATVADLSGVLTVFVKGRTSQALAVAGTAPVVDSVQDLKRSTVALASAGQPIGVSSSLAPGRVTPEAPAKPTGDDAREPGSAASHNVAGTAEARPESTPTAEAAPIPFLEPMQDFTVLATPRVEAVPSGNSSSEGSSGVAGLAGHAYAGGHAQAAAPGIRSAAAAKAGEGQASEHGVEHGAKPSAAHGLAAASVPSATRENEPARKPGSPMAGSAATIKRTGFSRSGDAAGDRAAEAHARGLALAAARAAGQLMRSAGEDTSPRVPWATPHGPRSTSVPARAVLPGSAPVQALPPARSNAPGEDAGDTECVPAAS
jgi:hypothetical protein